MLAGELQPGEMVGLEIYLPSSEDSLCARALVRHHDRLRCGMEFVGLSAQQQRAILSWTEGTAGRPESESELQIPLPLGDLAERKKPDGLGPGSGPPARHKPRSRGWVFLLLSAAILLAVLWWRWNRGWEDLEAGLPQKAPIARPEVRVPAEVMGKFVTHRLDPDYPAAARPAKLQGVIVLDVIIGRDGSVADVHALNGPEILAQAATDAMHWWRFRPYRVDGQAVTAETTVAIEFKP